MDPNFFVVEFDRPFLKAATVFGEVFVPLGAVTVIYAPELGQELGEPVWFIVAFGLFFVLFFGAWGVVAVRRLLRFGPALVLDAEGIENLRLGRMPWPEIAGFRLARLAGNDLLVIRLRDPGRALRGAWPWTRLVRWASLRRYGSPVVVPIRPLRTSPKGLLKTCKRFHAEAKKRGRQPTAESTSKR